MENKVSKINEKRSVKRGAERIELQNLFNILKKKYRNKFNPWYISKNSPFQEEEIARLLSGRRSCECLHLEFLIKLPCLLEEDKILLEKTGIIFLKSVSVNKKNFQEQRKLTNSEFQKNNRILDSKMSVSGENLTSSQSP